MKYLDVLVFGHFLNQIKVFGGFFVGVISLVIFAYLLTKVNLDFAGRAYAVYGGIYIVSSLFWLYFVEKQSFNKWDLIGAFICILGATIILIGNQK